MSRKLIGIVIYGLVFSNVLYGQIDTLKMKKYIIGLNFRTVLPDSIKFEYDDIEELSEHFSYSHNYTKSDNKYLLKIINDSFPERELMHRYKIEHFREDINNEVKIVLAKTNRDSLSVLDSIYQVYYNSSPYRKVELPIDIDLMLGLTNDTRFIPFLEKRYEEGYQKAAFALARMGEEPYLSKVLQAHVVDSIRRYGEAWYTQNSIHYNPDLLLYLCSEAALELIVEQIMNDASIILDYTTNPSRSFHYVDETRLDRNYESKAIQVLYGLIRQSTDSVLQTDFDHFIEKQKKELLQEIKNWPYEKRDDYINHIVEVFPVRINHPDLQKIRAFVAQNRDRLTDPANYKCPDYWKIEAGTEDFRTRHQRYR